MKTAQITYYGAGPLNLQMRRFKPGKSVRARLDDILPDERRRYADRFLVVGSNGQIINIGTMVPDVVAKEVISVNPHVFRVPGFDVRIPPGFAMVDNAEDPPMILDAAGMAEREAAKQDAKEAAAALLQAPKEVNIKLVVDDEDDLKPGETFEIGDTEVRVETVDPEKGEATLTVTPPVPAEDIDVTVEISEDETTIAVEPSGPDLNDSEEEPPAPAPNAAAKKKRSTKKKKPAKKKSRADSLLEEF